MKRFLVGLAIVLYFLAFTVFCFLYTFPYQNLTYYLNYLIQTKISDKLEIKSIKYHVPISFNIELGADNVQKYISNTENIYLKITPSLFKLGSFTACLYLNKNKIMDFHIAFKNILKKPNVQYIFANLQKFKLNSLPLYDKNVVLKGSPYGTIELKEKSWNLYQIKSKIQGLSLALPLYGIKKDILFSLEKLEGDLDKTKANIKVAKIDSPYFIIDGKGHIYFKKNILNSVISLSGNIDLNLQNIKKDLISFPFQNKSKLQYSLNGPISSIKYKVY